MNPTLKALAVSLFASVVLTAAEAQHGTYKGWQTLVLSNGMVQVQIVPDLGGRVIQCSLGGHDYLWVNPELAGKTPPPSRIGPNGEWLNYGGEKLWPAPQGHGGPDHWPGPPDPVLDGGPYEGSIVREIDRQVSARLISQKDPYSGIQFTRTISVPDGSARVLLHAVMTNIDTQPRRWSIWSVTELDASAHSGAGTNPDFRGYIPVNPQSHFPQGYVNLYGDENDSEFALDPRAHLLKAHYQHKVGKVGLDSPEGWVANVDGTRGYVFVHAFHFQPGREYPEGSSVEYWAYGKGKSSSELKPKQKSTTDSESPQAIETELLAPMETLQPGQSATFDYEWRLARIGGSFPILGCTAAGCMAEAFACTRASNGALTLSGRFGVFYSGTARLRILDANGAELSPTVPASISPDQPLILRKIFPNASAPANARTLELVVYDGQGKAIGTLARCPITTG